MNPVSVPTILKDIIDPRGVRAIRNEYSNEGRLVATIDADGQRIEYTHDIAGRTERVKDRRGFTSTFEYDDNGWVLSQTNALNETTRHSYDADGNELTTTDPLNHTTTRTFDNRGNTLTERNHLGETTTSTFDARNALLTQKDGRGVTVMTNTYHPGTGALLETQDALNHKTTFNYDSGLGSGNTGELLQMTDALNQPTTYLVDLSNGRRISETNALGHVTRYTYDTNGRVLTETRTRTVGAAGAATVESLVTRYTYDDKGRVTRTDLPDGSFSTTIFNAIDKPERECDALSRCTLTTYDARGNVTRVDYADGRFETKTYDASGNVLTDTDRAGRTTTMVYDAANRLVETIHPDPAVANGNDGNSSNNPRSVNEYDDAGRMIASINELGARTTYGYDDAGRQTSVTQPAVAVVGGALAPTTLTTYDTAGRRATTTDAEGHTTTFVYNDAGQVTDTVFHDGTRARVEFDDLGRMTADISPSGKRNEFGYDALSRLVEVRNAVGTANATLTRYRYDEQGNRIEQIDAENRATRFEFDSAGREIARVLPLGQRETKHYAVTGELDAHTDFNGSTTQFGHDAIGHMIAIDYPNDADVTTTYDASGQRATVTDGSGTTTYSFDARDRLLRKVDSAGHAVEYQYDAVGNLVSRISSAESLVYAYDALNRITSVTATRDGETPRTTRYEYDKVGNRTVMVASDNVRTEYQYDTRYRLTNLIKRTAASALLFAATYTVDADGLRTAVEETDATGISRTASYVYDGLKRLTRETIVARDSAASRTTDWTYDQVGNRQSQTALVGGVSTPTVTSYAYDHNDRLTSETTAGVATTYTYDPNGSTLTRSRPGELVEYAYNDANRLKEMREGGNRTTYRYDAVGLRIAQTSIPASGPQVTTQYVLDTNRDYGQVIEEWTSTNGAAPQLSAVLTFAGELLSQTRGGVTRVIHADGSGSTRFLTDQAGAITDRIDYNAFGEITARSGTTDVEHLYRGEQLDPNLGFYNLRARDYNPANGRFLTQDSFAGFNMDPPSLHRYAFNHNDPVNRIDPSGHYSMVEFMQAVNVLAINIGVRIAILGARHPVLAGLAGFVFNAALPAEMQVPTPVNLGAVFGSVPRGLLYSQAGKLSSIANAFARNRNFVAQGFPFEDVVTSALRLQKNTQSFTVNVAGTVGRVVPDWFWGARILEAKTSGGAIKLEQARRIAALAAEKGFAIVYVFFKKPDPSQMAKLEQAVAEGAQGRDVMLSINYIFE